MTYQRQVFIGMAHVLANPLTGDVLDGAKGAYVNILGFVVDEAEFIAEAMHVLNTIGLNMVDIEDVEPFSARLDKYEVDEKLLDLAKHVADLHQVMFGSFYTYPY